MEVYIDDMVVKLVGFKEHLTNLKFSLERLKKHVSYPICMPKSSTHHMHDPGSIVPHIRPKVSIDNQMS
jgi:hypothetical protein